MSPLIDEVASLSPVERRALALLVAVVNFYPESVRLSATNDRQDDLASVARQTFDLLCDDLSLG